MRSSWKRLGARFAFGGALAGLALLLVAPVIPWESLGWSQDQREETKKSGQRASADYVKRYGDEPAAFTQARRRMIERDLAGRDITDEAVLKAMARIPRHEYVPAAVRDSAYADHPLPIGHEQTISQPYIVALMTQLVDVEKGDRVLDIGTGSGYQAAVLGEICEEVYSIEIVEPLAKEAKQRLARLGYENVTVRHGDGYRGWQEKAPFDAVVVAAAPDHVPQPLIDQLAPGGKLVIPVGRWYQQLLLIERDEHGEISRRTVTGVRFVPMTGEAAKGEPER